MELLKYSKTCQLFRSVGVSLACTAEKLVLLPLTLLCIV